MASINEVASLFECTAVIDRSFQRPDSISHPHQKSELDNRGRQAPHVDESITEPTVTVDATKGGDDISLRHRRDVAKRKRLLHG